MTLIIKGNTTLTNPQGKLPDITTGLLANFDARTITGLAAGANVTGWANSGPLTGWNYGAPVAGREPTYAVDSGVAAVEWTATKSAYWAQAEATAQDVTPPATVSMLLKIKSHSSAYLTGGANVGGLLHGLWATLSAGGSLAMAALDSSHAAITLSTPISAGQWVVVSMVYAPTAQIYINGVKVAEGSFAMGPRSLIPRLMLGASATGTGGYLNGYIAHLAVHGRALAPTDAAGLNTTWRSLHGVA